MGERLSVEQFDCEDENLVEEYKDFKGGKNRPMSVSVRYTIWLNAWIKMPLTFMNYLGVH